MLGRVCHLVTPAVVGYPLTQGLKLGYPSPRGLQYGYSPGEGQVFGGGPLKNRHGIANGTTHH